MKKSLITFLFGESQVDEELAALVEDIEDMDTEGASTITVDKAPLSKIIDDLGIEGGSLEADPRGLSLVFDDNDLFRAAHALLNQPDSMYKLASAGWVYSIQGDVAQAYEPAQFRIRFLEIDNIEPENMKGDPDAGVDARNKKVAAIMKAGREFATTEPGHDEELNPVEFDDKTSDDRHKGMGKEKDGAQPEGKPKGSTKESQEPLPPQEELEKASQRLYRKSHRWLRGPERDKVKAHLARKGKGFHDTVESLLSEGGKYRRLKCDSCEALAINGHATHERGCPNSRKPWIVSDDDEHMVPGEAEPEDADESLAEGGHKAGCQCGFCKNKGKGFKRNVKDGNDDPEADEADEKQFRKDRSASSAGEEVRKGFDSDKVQHTFDSLATPEDVVNTMLEWNPKNPGTQPGILGTHSFSTMKVPGGNKDRKFSPAPGMVQPDSEIVNKQAKRKVNGGK